MRRSKSVNLFRKPKDYPKPWREVPLSIHNVKPLTTDSSIKRQYGTVYPDKIPFVDCVYHHVHDYNERCNNETIFKKKGERQDYIIQPKGMLLRGTYCVTELYSYQTRKIIAERLTMERLVKKREENRRMKKKATTMLSQGGKSMILEGTARDGKEELEIRRKIKEYFQHALC